MEESIDQREHLDSQSGANQIEGYSRESVLFKKRHQKPEANKNHHVNVLKNYKNILGSLLALQIKLQHLLG